MKITIEKIIYPGISLAKEKGKVILSDQGLPQEEIEVKIAGQKKDYIRAVSETVLKPSPHRITPKCSHYKICSSYQYIDYATQLKIKNEQLKEIFSNVIDQEKFTLKKVKPCDTPWHYRNKLHLHILKQNNCFVLAYHQPKSRYDFTEVKECFLASKQANRLLNDFIQLINRFNIAHLNQIIVRENQNNQMLVALIGKGNSKKLFKTLKPLSELQNRFPLAGMTYSDIKAKKQYSVFGKNYITDKICGKSLSYSAETFFQINVPMIDKLINDLSVSVDFDNNRPIVDLYCGVGLFAVILRDKAKQVFAVDASKQNHFFLKKNIKDNKTSNITPVLEECEKWAGELKNKKPGLVILDPPRRGLDRSVIDKIIGSEAECLAYVSCDPMTLARDLKPILKFYSLSDLFFYDFFPQTGHIECLAVLKRIKLGRE
jgi:23S rRNA (uracil1939-C5)-methyltransferase